MNRFAVRAARSRRRRRQRRRRRMADMDYRAAEQRTVHVRAVVPEDMDMPSRLALVPTRQATRRPRSTTLGHAAAHKPAKVRRRFKLMYPPGMLQSRLSLAILRDRQIRSASESRAKKRLKDEANRSRYDESKATTRRRRTVGQSASLRKDHRGIYKRSYLSGASAQRLEDVAALVRAIQRRDS